MLTLKEIAASLGVPESTLRIYRDEFEEFVPAQGQGRRRRYSVESAELLGQIVRRKHDNWSAGQIREELARNVRPQARTRRRNTEDQFEELASLLRAQSSQITLLHVEVGELRSELKRLIEVLRADTPASLEDILTARY